MIVNVWEGSIVLNLFDTAEFVFEVWVREQRGKTLVWYWNEPA